MSRPVQFVVKRGAGEVMIHWPDGTIEFVGFWSSLKLAFWIMRNGRNVVVVDGDVEPMPTGCHRSHPHENMSPECERKTIEAREAFYRAHDGEVKP